MTKYFRNAFATGGDREAVPDQAVGTLVNYEKGYTPEYELDPDVDPAGNYVGRRRMNQLFNDITGNLKFWQENGVPEIVANGGTGNPLSYKKGFIGSYLGTVYRALVDDTATLPPSAEWVVYDLQDELDTKVSLTEDQEIEGIKTFSQFPVMPSAAPTADYQVANKKYVDDSAIGVGQAWQDVTASRVAGTTYTNTTGRSIFAMIMFGDDRNGTGSVVVDGVTIVNQWNMGSQVTPVEGARSTTSFIVPPGATYSGNVTLQAAIHYWAELR